MPEGQLDAAVEGARSRATADYEEVRRALGAVTDALAGKDEIIAEMATTNTSNTAAIATLNEANAALNAEVADAVAKLEAFDLDTAFPPATPDQPAPPNEAPGPVSEGGGVNPPPVDTEAPVGTGTSPDAPPPPPEVVDNPAEIGTPVEPTEDDEEDEEEVEQPTEPAPEVDPVIPGE